MRTKCGRPPPMLDLLLPLEVERERERERERRRIAALLSSPLAPDHTNKKKRNGRARQTDHREMREREERNICHSGMDVVERSPSSFQPPSLPAIARCTSRRRSVPYPSPPPELGTLPSVSIEFIQATEMVCDITVRIRIHPSQEGPTMEDVEAQISR